MVADDAQAQADRNKLKKEAEWVGRQPQARQSKSKARIDAYQDLKQSSQRPERTQKAEIDNGGAVRMGLDVVKFKEAGLVVERTAKDGAAGGEMTLLNGFSYEFMRGERIGIVGRNGAGKTTFLNTLVGDQPLTAGECKVGETVRFGYYDQRGLETSESLKG